MKFNCKHTVVAKCLKLGAEMMPKHFAGMIFVHLFLAVLPVFGIQISRRIYQLAEKSVLSDYQVLTLLLPVLLYGAYLFLMKSYTIYYERVIVQFGGLLEFEKKTKLILHEKCGKKDEWIIDAYPERRTIDSTAPDKVITHSTTRYTLILATFASHSLL